MSTPNDGGAAFPVPPDRIDRFPDGDVRWTCAHPGMTLRDYFAAAALSGLLANSSWELGWRETSQHAYECADEMLAERTKTKEPQS
jgi:hypothetical protein